MHHIEGHSNVSPFVSLFFCNNPPTPIIINHMRNLSLSSHYSLPHTQMEEELENTTTANGEHASTRYTPDFQNHNYGETTTIFEDSNMYSDDIDSTCSTPFVSAPSSPGRGIGGGGGCFYYSTPTSPMHHLLCSPTPEAALNRKGSFEFDFSARFGSVGSASAGSMSSADELFLNGQIRPTKLSTHLQRPQVLAPLLDLDESEGHCENVMDDDAEKSFPRGRDVKWRDRSLRRRTRSMSPLRTSLFRQWPDIDDDEDAEEKASEKRRGGVLAFEALESKQNAAASTESTPSESASSSRSSSVSRSSKKWIFLKDLLYRSKSEGRNNNNGQKFWSSISFSPINKDKKAGSTAPPITSTVSITEKTAPAAAAVPESSVGRKKPKRAVKATNGLGKRRAAPSAHELHYTANRAQAEEMRKRTFLPYRQGLLGCLGFSSKSYGAMNGFARALNPVSSR